jgi:hypothetical protein
MSYGMIISAGIGLASNMMQDDAVGQASGIQSNASAAQAAEYRSQQEAVRKLMAPYVQTGTDALSQKRRLLGLGGLVTQPQYTRDELRNQLVGRFTKPTAAGSAGQTWVPGTTGWEDYASRNDRTNQTGIYAPGRNELPSASVFTAGQWANNGGQGGEVDEAGLNAEIERMLAEQQNAINGMGSAEDQQAAEIAKFENSPYFKAITRQSEDAMLQNASATGGLRGGNTMDALSKNRPILLQHLIDKQLANLTGLTDAGQNAAAGVGSAGLQTGQLVGGAIGTGAAAQAGGVLGQSNANISSLGNIGGMFAGKMNGMSNPFGNIGSNLQSGFSQTRMGGSGFGTGLAYGNQDLGVFL